MYEGCTKEEKSLKLGDFSFNINLTSYIIHHTSYITLTSYIIHHTSYIFKDF